MSKEEGENEAKSLFHKNKAKWKKMELLDKLRVYEELAC
jgi:hypothetical protein